VVSAFVVNVASAAAESDASGLALARANVDSMATSRRTDVWLRHTVAAPHGAGFRPFDAMEVVSGIDLVRRQRGLRRPRGATAWSQQLELRALSEALGDFDATASEIVVRGGGKAVKLIGDEIMFVADDPVAAVSIGLALTSAFCRGRRLAAGGASALRPGKCWRATATIPGRW